MTKKPKRAKRGELARLRKFFDDAGDRNYNVLALLDFYFDEMQKAEMALWSHMATCPGAAKRRRKK